MRALLLCISLSLLAIGCGGVKDYQPIPKKDGIFMPSMRSVGADPVYARTRWVRPPHNVPMRDIPLRTNEDLNGVPNLRPVFELALENVSLEETARVLAATSRYSSFTSPSIAKEQISVKNLGTIDELARIIEGKARISVEVDHEKREVRFLAPKTETPKLFEE
jgi:hypothetical protein